VEAERALTESMHQLEQKELSKTRFLAAAGHDLRQPIAAANLFVDALKLSSPTRQQSELIQRLEQSMGVFSGLLECLLDISKLDAGLIQPQLTTFDLAGIFEWLDQNFSEVASAKHLRFQFFFPANKPLLVRTDAELLKSVLMNLVSNAIKFTAHGGVLVSARPRGDSVLLQVWDSGIGIAESHLPYIFDEFYQVSNPQRDREAGLGLGLASCQRRMALLGGRVTCRSRPGRGSVFEITLPASATAADAGTIQAAGATPSAPGEIFLRGTRVVVIEDDKLVSEAMSAMLHARGVEVQIFNNAEQALRSDDIGSADYYIVDHNLGGEYSGLQFLEFMQQKRGGKVRAVILTGETSSRFLSGVSDSPWPVLNKPVTVAQLAARLNQ
jgi:CheY-like chemotaxis protein